MKEAKFCLEFTSHVLANSALSKDDQNVFQRDSTGKGLIFQSSWWHSAFTKAISLTKLRGIKPSDISLDPLVYTPTVVYDRRYGYGEMRKHEAIIAGTNVEFRAIVADHITESTLSSILDKLGTYVGISPFGHNLGYGKFKTVSIEVQPSEEA